MNPFSSLIPIPLKSARLGFGLVMMAGLLGTCPVAWAALAAERNLIEHSPFLPPGWGRSTTPAPPVETPAPPGALSRELEFRGIFEMNGVTRFNIFDKTEQKGAWHILDGRDARFSVIRYNEPKRSIMVRAGGRTEELTLAKPDDRSMPVVGIPAPGAPPTPPPNFTPPTPPPTSPPTSQPPSGVPPPPPGVGGQDVSGGSTQGGGSTAVPRRRVLRPSDAQGGGSSAATPPSGQRPTSGTMPPPPNFTPGPPPNMVPPPLPQQ